MWTYGFRAKGRDWGQVKLRNNKLRNGNYESILNNSENSFQVKGQTRKKPPKVDNIYDKRYLSSKWH